MESKAENKDTGEKVKIQPSDWKEGDAFVELDTSYAFQSVLIKGTIDDGGDINDPIPLTEVNTATTNKVIEFLVHLRDNAPPDIEKPIKSTDMEDLTTKFYADYTNVDLETLYDITLAANFMDIKPLVDLCCAKIGTHIKGKSIPEVRQLFGIENDFTPEEEAMEFDESLLEEAENKKEEEEKKA